MTLKGLVNGFNEVSEWPNRLTEVLKDDNIILFSM